MSYADHQRHAHHALGRVRVGILTVSDSRTRDSDASGDRLQRLVETDHDVVGRDVVRDDVDAIRHAVDAMAAKHADAIILNGGTGITPRDVTPEALQPWFERQLPGFGERLRALSQASIGSGAWLSRATAGTLRRHGRVQVVFLLPGSPDACTLAAEQLILPELRHLVTLAQGVRPRA